MEEQVKLMGSPAGCGSDFRQFHLNMIEGSRRLALLVETEMLAWRSAVNSTRGTTVCGHFFDERSKAMRICNLAVPCSATTKEANSALRRIPSLAYGGQFQCSPE